MKLKEVHRTATFAWSPFASLPLLATGTVAGALDESFSNESQLEIWAPDFLDKNEFDLGLPESHRPRGQVADNARPELFRIFPVIGLTLLTGLIVWPGVVQTEVVLRE